MNFTIPFSLAEVCFRKGVRHAVICPGSRSAPLTLAFVRNKSIQCLTFSDERSAGFVALGISQQTGRPVVLICTSGSAAYNFAPAVAEACFQQTPLLILTADRPAEWVDQLDGQTIRQKNLYGAHVKKYFELPQDDLHPDTAWHANRIINEALNLAMSNNKGPVHINASFREPLYPGPKERIATGTVRVIESSEQTYQLPPAQVDKLKKKLASFRKILIVPGQSEHDAALLLQLKKLKAGHGVIAGDILSNIHGIAGFVGHADTFLGQVSDKIKADLRPDLLITFGKSLVAKNLKLFLRRWKPAEHWHFQAGGEAPDTFQSLTNIVQEDPAVIVRLLADMPPRGLPAYSQLWLDLESKARNAIDTFFKVKRKGEFDLVRLVLNSLPPKCNLHLANSMAVRYANHIGLSEKQKDIRVYANRGTSGIDGCTSTAVGHALTSPEVNILVTGDLAFFYDRNAFWHNYSLKNLVIVVLNNHGGIIFNLIDGPGLLPEAGEFFITRQQLSARALAAEFGFDYRKADSVKLKDLFKPGKTVRILEIESSQSTNKKVFESFKKHIKKRYES